MINSLLSKEKVYFKNKISDIYRKISIFFFGGMGV
jgi:hypothetical protein